MPYVVHISDRALREIHHAFDWLEERSPAAAARWRDGLLVAIHSLENNPERHPLAPESEWYPLKIRQALHGKKRSAYRILFVVRDDEVHILRVRHGAQNLLMPGEL